MGLLGLTPQANECRKCYSSSCTPQPPGFASLLFRKNCSSEQVQGQWSGPVEDPISWKEGCGALISMALIEWPWLLARVAGQLARGIQVAHQTFPSILPRASTAHLPNVLMHLHSNSFINLQVLFPFFFFFEIYNFQALNTSGKFQ